MATRGIAIQDVNNILDSNDIKGTEKIPVSSGQSTPQVVTTQELKEYINKDIEIDREFTLEEMEQILNF